MIVYKLLINNTTFDIINSERTGIDYEIWKSIVKFGWTAKKTTIFCDGDYSTYYIDVEKCKKMDCLPNLNVTRCLKHINKELRKDKLKRILQ